MIHFDSDYMEGCCPEVMEALVQTNLEQTVGYGYDAYSDNAKAAIRKALEADVDIHFLIGGTQTNTVMIDALLRQHEGVLAAETAHINVHESGAIETTGHKVLTLPTLNGKVCAADVKHYIDTFYADETYEHMVAPGMLYLTFPTEMGTLYTKAELEALHEVCINAKIPMYIDGARLGYGLASPACDIKLADLPSLCEAFYIGGTKVGALFGEAVVARKGLIKHFFPLQKQHGAVLAKGRLLGVQFGTLFTDGLYLRIAKHAVGLALELKKGLLEHGYKLFIDSYTNQQFVVMPNEVMDRLANVATFEVWGIRGEKETPVRFVTSWATKREDVVELIANL